MALYRGYGAVLLVAFNAAGLVASAQSTSPGYLIVENYYWASPPVRGASNRSTWFKGEYRLNDDLKLVGTFMDVPIYEDVKRFPGEGYAEIRKGDVIARAGRIPLKFGFGEWSDLAYTPISRWPMVRVNPINSLGLYRFDAGADVEGGTPNLQYQIALVDAHTDSWQFGPSKADHAALHLQTASGSFILGFSGMSKVNGGAQTDAMAGVDLRWTSGHAIVRAEYDRGFDQGANAEGGYFDFFYRPENLFRTQLGLRQEFYHPLSGQTANLTTVGIRQILNENFVANLNYGVANSASPATRMKGWSFQLMSSVRF